MGGLDLAGEVVKLIVALAPMLIMMAAGRNQVTAADATKTVKVENAMLAAAAARPADFDALAARLRGRF